MFQNPIYSTIVYNFTLLIPPLVSKFKKLKYLWYVIFIDLLSWACSFIVGDRVKVCPLHYYYDMYIVDCYVCKYVWNHLAGYINLSQPDSTVKITKFSLLNL